MSIDPRDDAEVVTRRVIVTALPLKAPARERLAQLLQARVFDVRDPVDHVDVVLTPPCSPQLIHALRRKYDEPQIVVVELDDWEFHVELPGPVKRILRSGADAYVLADSLEELARKIATSPPRSGRTPSRAEALSEAATVDQLIAAFLQESVEYSTRLRRHAPPGQTP